MKLLQNKKKLIAILLLQFYLPVFASASGEIEMADTMRSEGKIYVVVAVIAIIFSGISLYLYSIDRKVGKIEKEFQSKNN